MRISYLTHELHLNSVRSSDRYLIHITHGRAIT